MNENQFLSRHTSWLNSGNPADINDEPECPCCGSTMDVEEDFDVDEETGTFYSSGNTFKCTNNLCK